MAQEETSHDDPVRMKIAWEIVQRSGVGKEDPLRVAMLVHAVDAILRTGERPSPAGSIAALPCAVTSNVAKGETARITYAWNGGPASRSLVCFVHFCDSKGEIAFQDDHEPTPPTQLWSGPLSYPREVRVPEGVASGKYQVLIGLYDPDDRGERMALICAPPVAHLGGRRYEVGEITVR